MCTETLKPENAVRYVRAFSDLGEFQQAYEISYQLQKQGVDFMLEVRQKNASERAERVLLQLPEEKAMQVLTMLYENAVPLEIWKDVLQDLQVSHSVAS